MQIEIEDFDRKSIQIKDYVKKFDVPLSYNPLICWYLAELDDELLSDGDVTQLVTNTDDTSFEQILKKRLKNPRIEQRFARFHRQTCELFNALINHDNQSIKKYIDRKIYFLTGLPYKNMDSMYRELSSVISLSTEGIEKSIIKNAIPYEPGYVSSVSARGSLGWREPTEFYKYIFEFAQYFVYLQREAADSGAFINFNWLSAYFLGFLDDFLGKKATYVVVISEPDENITESFPSNTHPEIQKFISTNPSQFWETFYREVIRDAPFNGRFIPIASVNDWRGFIEAVSENSLNEKETRNEKVTRGTLRNVFHGQSRIEHSTDRIEKFWSAHGYQFPLFG